MTEDTRRGGRAWPSVRIVIVNWNSGPQLRACLRSIASCARGGVQIERVVVVDNGSADGSADSLEETALPLAIIRNTNNRGFAAACNQGAANSSADYVLLVNPDTLLAQDALVIPVRFMECRQGAQIGICGIQLLDEEGKVRRDCARLPTPAMFYSKMLGLDKLSPKRFPSLLMAEWDHLSSRQVGHVPAAFSLIRRSLFEALGGMDERFFMYLEDLDFSYRAQALGWTVHYLADAHAFHKGGGTSVQVKADRLAYSLHSRILYGYKHFRWWSATLLAAATLAVEPVTRLVLAAVHRSAQEAQETLCGYAKLWRTLIHRRLDRARQRAH